MSLGTKLNSLTNRTLVNTDIMPVQDSAGASWYKTTLAALKSFLYTEILGTINTWTGSNTFSHPVTIPDGTASTHAVTKSQMEAADSLKQDSISSNDTEVIFNNAGTIMGSSYLRIKEYEGLFNFKTNYIPTSSGDTLGEENDVTFDRDYIYVKTVAGWKRASLLTF